MDHVAALLLEDLELGIQKPVGEGRFIGTGPLRMAPARVDVSWYERRAASDRSPRAYAGATSTSSTDRPAPQPGVTELS